MLGLFEISIGSISVCVKGTQFLFKSLCRLDARTMFKVRKWERFQFLNDYNHSQANTSRSCHSV